MRPRQIGDELPRARFPRKIHRKQAACLRTQVHGASRELGRLTTVAVVQAIFLVLLADALFAILFMEIDV